MDVLIAGAGVGGLALARGLLADGHQVRVLEQAPGPRQGGAALTIFSNGAAALAGLGAPMDGVGGLIEEMEFCDANGAALFRVDLRVLRRRTGFAVVTVPRERLVEHLAQGLPPQLIRYHSAVESVTVLGDTVDVTDSQGGRHAAQVLVGADGYRSAVRRAVVDTAPAQHSGWVTWQGLTPVLPDLAAGTRGRYLVGDAGFCGLMPAGNGLLQWWFDVPGSPADFTRVSAVTWLRARFAHYAHPVPALLDAVSDADLGSYPHVLHQVPAQWGRGPTTLIGDAAHAFPPSQAQGANQTFEDAWLLTRALRLPEDPAELLRRYERRRVPRVRRVSRMAANQVTNRPPGAAARLAGLIPAALSGRAYLALIRRFSSVLNNERP
jgi:FAD-dependent urate hydroxylase